MSKDEAERLSGDAAARWPARHKRKVKKQVTRHRRFRPDLMRA
jgi:hypothetical protein